jgi:hypothetical protein
LCRISISPQTRQDGEKIKELPYGDGERLYRWGSRGNIRVAYGIYQGIVMMPWDRSQTKML